MDIKKLLERIREIKDRLDRANRIINICSNECHSSGILAEEETASAISRLIHQKLRNWQKAKRFILKAN